MQSSRNPAVSRWGGFCCDVALGIGGTMLATDGIVDA